MVNFKISLGGISDTIHALFLPKTTNPDILILSKENFLILVSLRSGMTIAVLKKSTEEFKKILRIEINSSFYSKTVLIAAGFDNGWIQIWKMNISKSSIVCVTLKGHIFPINSFRFFSQKQIFFSACQSGNLVFWDLKKKIGLFKIKKAHQGKINQLCLVRKDTRKLKFLLTYGEDNFIRFWDIKTGFCLKTLNSPFIKILSIEFFWKENLLLFLNDYQAIVIYGIKKFFSFCLLKKIQSTMGFKNPNILYDKSESFLFVYGKNKFIDIFFLKKKILNFSNQVSKAKHIQKKPKLILKKFTHSLDSKIKGIDIWENNFGKDFFILVHYMTNFIDLYKVKKKRNLKKKYKISLKHIIRTKMESNPSDVREIIWFSNDFFIASLYGLAKKIYIWFLNSQKCSQTIPIFSSGICMSLSGKNQIILGNKKGNIELFNLSTGNLIFSKTKAHIGPIWTIDLVKNFFQVVSGGADGMLKIWDFELNEIKISKYLHLRDQILSLKISSTKNLIILSSLTSKLLFFLIDSLQFSFSLQGHSLPIMSLDLHIELSLIATGSADNSLKIWDIKNKNLRKSLNHHSSAITAVVFQKSTGNIFSGSRCGKICYWSKTNFKLLAEIKNYHLGPIWALRISSNGNFLASGSQDKKLIIWKINEEKAKKNFSKLSQTIENENDSIKILQKKKVKKQKIDFFETFESFFFQKTISKNKRKKLNEKNSNILNFFEKMDRKDWEFFLETKKTKTIFFFLNLVFEKIKNDQKLDLVAFCEKFIYFLNLAKKKKIALINSTVLIKIKKEIKKFLLAIKEKLEKNLNILNFFKIKIKKKKSDLPDSN